MDASAIDRQFSAMLAGKPAARVIQAAPGRPPRRKDAEDAPDEGNPMRGNGTFGPTGSRCLIVRNRELFARAYSESRLLEILPHDLEEGTSYHVLSNGDISAISYVRHVMRLQPLDYLLGSTWVMSMADVAQLEAWIAAKHLGRLDFYAGEIFPGSYGAVHSELCKLTASTGGRVAIFRNHSKVFAGIGPKFAFLLETSANVNLNPRCECAVLTIGRAGFDHAKGFYDGITSFTKGFPDWQPWEPKR